jgi:hemerythrin-like domain-containing protein
MESKPIKRDENILKLSRDHHLGLLFCWKIRQGLKMGVSPERIAPYVQHFWMHHLQEHFAAEENILFAPQKDILVQKAIDQHRDIRMQIEQIAATAKPEALVRLADRVDNHIRFEERELFPHLEKMLSKAQLKTIGEQLGKDDTPLIDDYPDAFWIKQQ